MQTIQYRKSRIWEMKEDKYRLCQESGLCNMLDARYSEKRFTQIYKALYGNAMFEYVCVPFRGTNMAAGNQQKHLFLSFPTYA